jgi:hypothetical protein
MGRSGDAVSTIHMRRTVLQLYSLSMERMLVLSRYWLGNTDAQRAFASHELGPPLRNQIARAYADLSQLQMRRHNAGKALELLRAIMEALDDTHDRFARALHCHLTGLIATASDPAEAAWYRDTLDVLFPRGLMIVNSSYAEEAGMATSLEQQITPEILARLATIQVGEHTLADICRRWLDAGIALGERVIERGRLQTSISGAGLEVPMVGIRQVRSRWVRAVNAMISAVDLMELPESLREALMEPLERMVALALRQRTSQPAPPSGDIDGDIDGDINGNTNGDIDGGPDGDIDGGPDGDTDGDTDGDVPGDVLDVNTLAGDAGEHGIAGEAAMLDQAEEPAMT